MYQVILIDDLDREDIPNRTYRTRLTYEEAKTIANDYNKNATDFDTWYAVVRTFKEN